jgi:hypothetical protein
MGETRWLVFVRRCRDFCACVQLLVRDGRFLVEMDQALFFTDLVTFGLRAIARISAGLIVSLV